MNYQTTETIQRLWSQFLRDQMEALPPDQRQQFEQQFENRFSELLKNSSNGGIGGLNDLLGLGDETPVPFEDVSHPYIEPDFEDAVNPSQLHAAADLYYTYQHERMKVFKVIEVLQKLFHLGKINIQRGPGARSLYLTERWKPLRYAVRDRMVAYRRVFNYGKVKAPAGAIVNVNFHRQLVGFMVAVAQYNRDLQVSEVIRGGPMINQRPFGSVATVQRIALDLRYALNRTTYGNIFALTLETGHYLKSILQLLDTPDIKKAFNSSSKWGVVESVSNRHLGGSELLSQRTKMAESGRRVLQFIADNDFKTGIDSTLFQSEIRPIVPYVETWLACYRMTPEGQRFPGVAPALGSVTGRDRIPV